MRVLLLFSSSELGGAERSLTRMALVPSGIEYHFATLDGEGPWCDWMRDMGQEPRAFGSRRTDNTHGRFGLEAVVPLVRYVRRERIDVIYVCGIRAAFVLRCLKFVMPQIRLVQGIRWNPGSDSRLDRGFRLAEKWLHGLVDLYIANSKIATETLTARCGIPSSRVRVIYNGLAEIPAEIPPLTERPLEVLTVANLNPRKGHREYLRAVRLVLDVVPGARFVFVGRDDMRGEVQRAIDTAGLAHAVFCEGFQADVSAYFRQARVCVLPSLWDEGSPTSLLESLAWGVPVVAYGVDGVPELVSDGVDGYLVPVGDSNLLAERIIDLLSGNQVAATLGMSGRAKVTKGFSIGTCAQLHALVFNKLLDGD